MQEVDQVPLAPQAQLAIHGMVYEYIKFDWVRHVNTCKQMLHPDGTNMQKKWILV